MIKRGGRAVATFFIVDEAAASNISRGLSALKLDHLRQDGCWAKRDGIAEEAIGYPIGKLTDMFRRTGFKAEQMHAGRWSGRPRFLTYQDLLVLSPI